LKKKIAIIIPGGVSGGSFSQGIPVLEDLIERLSTVFDITVYSLIKIDADYKPKNFKLRHTNLSIKRSLLLKILICIIIFIFDNLRNKFSLIHGIWVYPSSLLAVILGKIFKIPTLVSLQGGEAANIPEIGYGNMLSGLKKKITLWTCKNANELTSLTLFQIEELKKYGFVRNVTHIIPYGVNENIFTLNEKILKPPFNFIHIANLTYIKDQVTLLKAFNIICRKVDCTLQIIGDGELRENLKSHTIELGIEDKVIFLGAIQNRKLPLYLHQANIMLHTSLYEGQGVVLVEAAACGVVVCGTKVGLISDWGDAKCISVNIRDYEKLAKKVLELLENRDRFVQIQKNAYEWSIENTATNTANLFQNLYNRMIK
jgi:glycosyltransferase involved in cell wall biosynthesis